VAVIEGVSGPGDKTCRCRQARATRTQWLGSMLVTKLFFKKGCKDNLYKILEVRDKENK
jgi:hypothetical protein